LIVEIVWVMGWVHRNLKDHNTESASGVVGVRDFGTAALSKPGLEGRRIHLGDNVAALGRVAADIVVVMAGLTGVSVHKGHNAATVG